MDPIPLNAVRAAAADVAADTAGTAVAAHVTDFAGAAADARAALPDVTAVSAVVAAAADSAGDLYRRACRAIATSTSPAPPVLATASDFKTSGQGMAAVSPIRAPVELFHADEANLQVAQTVLCSQSRIPFLESIRRGETIQDSTANLLFGYLNIVIMYVEG